MLVTVQDVAPQATVTNSGTTPEGSPVTFTLHDGPDPDPTDSITYWADWDGSSGFEEITRDEMTDNGGGSVSFTHVYDDNGDYSASIRVMDSEGKYTDYTTDVEVTNVAPSAGSFGPRDTSETDPAENPVEFTDVTDPSQADMDAGFTYYYSVDGGSYTSSTSPEFFVPDYQEGTTYTISAYIEDKDGGDSQVYTTTLDVPEAPVEVTNTGSGVVQLSWDQGSGPVEVGPGQTQNLGAGATGLTAMLETSGASYDLRTNGSMERIYAAAGVASVQLTVHTDLVDQLGPFTGDGHVGEIDLPAGTSQAPSTLSVYARGDLGTIQGPQGAATVDAHALDLFFANLTGSITNLEHIDTLHASGLLGTSLNQQVVSETGIDTLFANGIGASVTADRTDDPADPGTTLTVGPDDITGTVSLGGGANLLERTDSAGNVVSLTDPGGNQTTFTYDVHNNPLSLTDPLGNTDARSYDPNNNLVGETNRNGLSRALTYDDAGRVLTETWYAADGSTTVDERSFMYDANGNVLTASNNTGTYTYTYDAAGRMLAQTDPNGLTLTFGYDDAGNVTSVQDSLGGLITSVFDPQTGRLTSRQYSGPGQTPLRIDFTYDANGNVLSQTRYSDLAGTQETGVSTYAYDSNQQVSHIQHLDASGNVLADFAYSYDAKGFLTAETDNGVTTNYAYDAAGQLISAGSQTWSYDANGNRIMAGYVTGAGNQLLSDGTWNYAYDAEGNLTGKTNLATGETWAYAYDHADRLTSADQRDSDGNLLQHIDYQYDVFGQRIGQSVWSAATGTATITRFAYAMPPGEGDINGGAEVWADLDGSDTLQTRYLRGDGVDQLFGQVDGSGNLTGYLTDHLGSVRDLTNGSGAVRASFAFDPFGNLTAGSAGQLGRYGWTGRELDAPTGFYHSILGRNYNPATGRWNSQDPTLYRAHDSNLYRYVNNSPVNGTDPGGNWPSWMPRWAARAVERAEVMAQNTANYAVQKVQQVFTTIVVAGQTIRAKFQETINAAGQTIQYIVSQTGQTLVAVGGKLVEATEFMARRFADELAKFGRAITDLWALADKFGQSAGAVLKAIVDNPGAFALNLSQGIAQGFNKFFQNFGTYLPNQLFEWLTKGISLAGIQRPSQWNLQGMGSFLLQLMGLTWDNLQSILVKHIGPQNVAWLTEAYNLMQVFVDQGPAGVFTLLQEKLSGYDPQQMVKDAIQAAVDFIVPNVAKQVAIKIVGLFSPIPATLLVSIYNGLDWFFSNAQQLGNVATTVLNGINDVVNGNPSKLADAVNQGLQGLIGPMIDFGAAQIGLKGLPQEIGRLVQMPRKKVEAAIDRVIDGLKAKGLGLLGIPTAQANDFQGLVAKLVKWQIGTDNHKLWVVATNGQPDAFFASVKQQLVSTLGRWRSLAKNNPGLQAVVDAADKLYKQNNGVQQLSRQIAQLVQAKSKPSAQDLQQAQVLQKQLWPQLEALGAEIQKVQEAFWGLNLLLTGPYGKLKNKVPGAQVHHLNQGAAFDPPIKYEDGVSIVLWGRLGTDKASPHSRAHEVLEAFWADYRKGGKFAGDRPTNGQYAAALVESLKAAGFIREEVDKLVAQAAKQRLQYGLTDDKPVPQVPPPIPGF